MPASTLTTTNSDMTGSPKSPCNASRTSTNAASEAMTAPYATSDATFMIGRNEPNVPLFSVSIMLTKRLRFNHPTTRQATTMAMTIDQIPATADSGTFLNLGVARYELSIAGMT